MTYLDILNLNGALASINAPQTVIAEDKPVSVKRRLSAECQLAIAKAMIALKPTLKGFELAKETVISSHGGPFKAIDSPGAPLAQKEINEMLLAELSDAPAISFSSIDLFKCDDLPIEAEVIAILIPYCAA